MESLDVMDIKQHNVKSIMNVLRNNGWENGMTKREIAQETSLSFATVSNLCNELLERGIVETGKSSLTSVGRTPFSVKLAYNRFCTICLNLQMKGILRIAVLNLRNELVFHQSYDISGYRTPQEVVRCAREAFERDARAADDEQKVYIGVGVAVSGIFDLATQTLVNCAVKMYEGVALKALIEEEFQLPGYVDNEANLCALSLKHRIHECRNLVYLHISEGVGVGIISEGTLLRGCHGYGGEIAHMPLGDASRRCPECGSCGCIENELAVPYLVRAYYGEAGNEVLRDWERLTQKVRAGEEKALALVGRAAGYLGVLTALLISILDPEYLYIGGELTEIYEELYPRMYAVIEKRCFMYGNRKIQIVKDLNSDLTIHSGINELIYDRWKP